MERFRIGKRILVRSFLLLIFAICTKSFALESQKNATSGKPKVALVLSGGGASGLAEIPLLEALEEEGIVPDMVLGVSMGSIIGSLYCIGYSPKEIRTLLTETDIMALLNHNPSSEKNLFPVRGTDATSNFWIFPFSKKGFGSEPGVISDQNLTNMLAECFIKKSYITDFDKFDIPLRIVCTDVFSGEKIICKNGSLLMAVRGSMSVPVVFPPFPTEGKSLAYDGGLSDNLPIQIAKDMGADVIIAMDVLGKINVEQKDFNSINSTFIQSINLIVAQNTLNQYETADILIRPDLSAINAGEFGHQKEIIEVGEKAVSEKREEIHKLCADLQKKGFQVESEATEYNRTSNYAKIHQPVIERVSVRDISVNNARPIPKSADFSFFVGKEINSHSIKRLTKLLDQLKSAYNLSTLTFQLKEIDAAHTQSGNFELEILANYYEQKKNKLYIGGRPAVQCNFTKSILDSGETKRSTEFIMLPFITAGMIIKDVVPVNLEVSSDSYFSGKIEAEPLIKQSEKNALYANIGVKANYGSLHPARYLTYSTLLADDDFGSTSFAEIKLNHLEHLTVEWGLEHEFFSLHGQSAGRTTTTANSSDHSAPENKSASSTGTSGRQTFHSLDGFFNIGYDSMKNDITDLSGTRAFLNAKLGSDFNIFTYKAKAGIFQDFELKEDLNSLGYGLAAGSTNINDALLAGWFDLGNYDGLSGYGYGSFVKNYVAATLTYKQTLFSMANMPLLLILKTSAGFYGKNTFLSADENSDLPLSNFDAGVELNLAFRTPVGNIIFGGGVSFIQKNISLTLSFM